MRRRERGCGKKSVFRVSRRSAEETASFDTVNQTHEQNERPELPGASTSRRIKGGTV